MTSSPSSRVGIGRSAESVVARHLETRGWRVLARNWRDGPRELDLVVARGGIVAFVEVKSRSGSGWGDPLEGITRRKRLEVERAARAWVRAHPGLVRGRTFRLDAAAVRFRGGGAPEVEVVADAWRVLR